MMSKPKTVSRVVSMKAPGCSPPQQAGYTLIELVIALFLMGTVVVGTLGVMGHSARTAMRGEESVRLLQLARAQIELIQSAPFSANPTAYPATDGIPEGYSVTWASGDSGTQYQYPAPDSSLINGAIQKITVTAHGEFSEMSITFYKVKLP